ncbi:MAG TPA: hypothetical protein VEK73_12020 [Xanthobacteraceae bacterium]|nr:hypothetical protein [Xanthobacteraceae bacterium]
MRRIAVAAVAALVVAAVPARADNQPVIAVPGKPGVPVVINGVEATGAVVYGDWGLFRPGGAVVIDGGRVLLPPDWSPHYFPATGRMPAYGRKEIDPHSPRPTVAQPYHKSWSIESQPGPATEYAPFAAPPVIVVPPEHRRPGQRRPEHEGP